VPLSEAQIRVQRINFDLSVSTNMKSRIIVNHCHLHWSWSIIM